MNTAAKLINSASKKIEPVSNTPYLEAELLLCFIKKISRNELYLNPDVDLSDIEEAEFGKLVEERSKGVPHAYITGIKEFYGREFIVSQKVLIPRPETELIIDETKRLLREVSAPVAVDLGTGSGCIAVTLAEEIAGIKVIACDIDSDALKIAKTNAIKFGVESSVSFVKSDLLKEVNVKADVIVANLPYVLETDKDKMEEKYMISLKYEPQHALFAGDDGLNIYKRLIEELKKNTPKFLLLEIDPRQSNELSKMISDNLSPKHIEIKKDLAGHDRVIISKF